MKYYRLFALVVALLFVSGCGARIHGIGTDGSSLRYVGKVKGNPATETVSIGIETPYRSVKCTGKITPGPSDGQIFATGTLDCLDGRLLDVVVLPLNEKQGLGHGVFSNGVKMSFGYGYKSSGQVLHAFREYASSLDGVTPASTSGGSSGGQGGGAATAKPPKKKDGKLEMQAHGTGFFVTTDGIFITNNHVVDDGGEIRIYDSISRKMYTAEILATDTSNDLAVLKVKIPASTPLPLGKSATVRKGDELMALGYPIITLQGLEQKATFGRINSLTGMKNDVRVFQIDAPIQPGNSGGPLINNKGQVVGVTTYGVNQMEALENYGTIVENANYAVKVDYVHALLTSLPHHYKGQPAFRVRNASGMADLVQQCERSVMLVTIWK